MLAAHLGDTHAAAYAAELSQAKLGQPLANWAEIHHILTSRYAADGRYPHRWNKVRAS